MYGVTFPYSFDHVNNWLIEVVNQYESKSIFELLVENKYDQMAGKAVTSESLKAFADKFRVAFLETSEKSTKNVEVAFLTLTGELIMQRGAKGEGD